MAESSDSEMMESSQQKRIEQENRVLKVELETFRLRVKSLQEENRALRQASVNIQARAEQEEEFISNTLLKQIKILKKEKETLALNYEQEEECLTNDLSRKLSQLRQEKVQLEQSLEQEQEALVGRLMRRIERLEAETEGKQRGLEQLRREKVELENTLEQEQEALVNRLWKRMDKLEAEKRMLQEKLEQPVSAPPSPRDNINNGGDLAVNLTMHVQHLRNEVCKLKTQLLNAQQEHSEKMAAFAVEERHGREENVRLQQRLRAEVELCRHLSESESSLDEERYFNDNVGSFHVRPRAASSPVFHQNISPNTSRPLSPGDGDGRCPYCNQPLLFPSQSPGAHSSRAIPIPPRGQDRFARPPPPPPNAPSAPLQYRM